MATEIDNKCVTAIRMLSVDQVEAANAGHPGLPLGLAPAAYALFARVLRHSPANPSWPGRDRFVLSAGHGSALLYSMLHLFGYGLTVDDLRSFRQLGSLTPGHPEHGHTVGVETTTGPLGQGISTAVGMALAEEMLRSRAAELGHGDLVSHYTFVFASDGDLMEGISHEAASFAGHLGLGRLVVVFDSNDITIDGSTSLSCSDDARARFASYGWHTLLVENAQDVDAITAALEEGKAHTEAPTLIELKSVIGYGAPNKAGKSSVHGSPLGAAEMAATRAFFGWDLPPFEIPADVYAHFAEVAAAGDGLANAWQESFAAAGSEVASLFTAEIPSAGEISSMLAPFASDRKVATRVSSKEVLAQLLDRLPAVVGGTADLGESTGTNLELPAVRHGDFGGKLIHFGIREHGMSAVLNGIALHGGFVPFGSTFLVFADYSRPAIRLAAMMKLPVTFIFTHDSIAVGEDGPTHQPVEQVAALRAIPGLRVMRPADGNETIAAWSVALGDGSMPSALIFTRQALPTLSEVRDPSWVTELGAQVVWDPEGAKAVIFATGSEVSLAVDAAKHLAETRGMAARVVSVLWRERFLEATKGKLQSVTSGLPTVVVEALSPVGWESLVESTDDIVAMRGFGASGKGPDVQAHFGFTPPEVAARIAETIARRAPASADVSYLNAELVLERSMVSACTQAARACVSEIGRGDRKRADHLAVEAMRNALRTAPVSLRVVIGEGEKDEAPMLFRGEQLGSGSSTPFDIAVDPLEGTNYVAKGQPGAVSVIAAAPAGNFTFVPGFYMDKIVVGSQAKGVLTIESPVEANLEMLAKALEKRVDELEVIVLDKPRHKELISRIRSVGARVREVPDGDVMASFEVLVGHIDALFGVGGAPEGVIMAAMAKALGGEFQGRLAPQSEAEARMVRDFGEGTAEKVFGQDDLVTAEPVVAITSVTGAGVLDPVVKRDNGYFISTALIRNGSYSVVSQFA